MPIFPWQRTQHINVWRVVGGNMPTLCRHVCGSLCVSDTMLRQNQGPRRVHSISGGSRIWGMGFPSLWRKPMWLPRKRLMLRGSGGMHPQKNFCEIDALRRVFMISGAILGAYIAEGRILVSLLYCTITTVAQTLTWVNPCPLNLELQVSFPSWLLHTHTNVERERERDREREGLKESKK